MTLFWKVFLMNATLLAVAAVMLALTPATVSRPLLVTEALVLAGGVGLLVLVNWLLLRRAFAPFEQLKRLMAGVDPLRPGARMPPSTTHPEFAEVAATFNEMMQRLEEERRESARRASAAEQEERRRVARELHDEVGQRLGALLLTTQGLVTSAPPEFAAPIEDLREELRGTLEEVREIAKRLRPETLDELGLPSALTALTRSFSKAGLDVRRTIERPLPPLSADDDLAIYRIAQEALTNVARHSCARTAALDLRAVDGSVVLTVRDDGVGLDAGARDEGQGLRGMQERAITVGGRLQVRSGPGGGTEVELILDGSR